MYWLFAYCCFTLDDVFYLLQFVHVGHCCKPMFGFVLYFTVSCFHVFLGVY